MRKFATIAGIPDLPLGRKASSQPKKQEGEGAVADGDITYEELCECCHQRKGLRKEI